MSSWGNFFRPGGNRFSKNFRSISREDGFFDPLIFANLILVNGRNITEIVPCFDSRSRPVNAFRVTFSWRRSHRAMADWGNGTCLGIHDLPKPGRNARRRSARLGIELRRGFAGLAP